MVDDNKSLCYKCGPNKGRWHRPHFLALVGGISFTTEGRATDGLLILIFRTNLEVPGYTRHRECGDNVLGHGSVPRIFDWWQRIQNVVSGNIVSVLLDDLLRNISLPGICISLCTFK